MRIRTRLFLLIALLVLAVVGVQWWLGVRQIESSQQELVTVATTVGHRLIEEIEVPAADHREQAAPSTAGSSTATEAGSPAGAPLPAPDEAAPHASQAHMVVLTSVLQGEVACTVTPVPGPAGGPGGQVASSAGVSELPRGAANVVEQRLDLQFRQGDDGRECFLVLSGPDGHKLIPIPVAAPTRRARLDLQRGLLLSGGLLAAGLMAAAVIAHRVTGPLRQLAAGVEAVGQGGFQTRVQVTAGGEVGDLQRSFNEMAGRLTALESERDAWRAREHLAQLGDLARGLAHTLRNPLNTLGLAVEELAGRADTVDAGLVATARAQIRRVDRWLLSFLALGAGQGIEAEPVDLDDLSREVVLEAAQTGADVRIEAAPGPVEVWTVRGALRAALANLVENAVQASPEAGTVTVEVALAGRLAVLRVADRGPGLPPEVRRRLFEPHVTTRVGGAGMGLFLARQLVEAGLGGHLELRDREDGGTVAVITLDALEPGAAAHVS